MKDLLLTMLEDTGDLTIEQILLRIAVSTVIALAIGISYRISHVGSLYSRKFNVTLMVLTVLTTTVMTVISNNIALSLGMVGALSIVRFRTAIKDARDTAYIFWTIIVGICCGAGDFTIAAIGSSAVFALLLLLGAIKNDDRMLLIIRCARNVGPKVEALVFQYFGQKARLRVKNTSETNAELIYELSRRTVQRSEREKKPITEAVYDLTGIEYANLIVQNDEIGS